MSIYFTFILSFFFEICFKTGRVIITLYALKLGAQSFTVGAMAAMLSVLPTLLSWYAGKMADRFGSRWLLMMGTAAGTFGMLAPYVLPGLPALFFTSVMYGLLSTLSAAPVQNLVGLQSNPQDSAKNFSNLSLIFSFGSLAGPLLAGFSIDHAGPDASCLGIALLSLVPAAMLVIWGSVLPRGSRAERHTGSFRILLSESELWRVLVISSLVMTGVDLFQVFMPIYGYGIGLSASAIGIILAICASAAFGVRFFLPSLTRRLSAKRVLAYSFLIGATGFLLVPFFKSIWILNIYVMLA